MQYDRHVQGLTDAFKAISIRQPYADEIAKGELNHILLSKNSDYRGEVLIVASPIPRGERSGMIVGRATLDSVDRVTGGFLFRFSNPERIIEFPCQKCGAKGVVWDCFYTKGTIVSYPKISLREWILKK